MARKRPGKDKVITQNLATNYPKNTTKNEKQDKVSKKNFDFIKIKWLISSYELSKITIRITNNRKKQVLVSKENKHQPISTFSDDTR